MLKTVIITFMAVIVCAGPGIGGTISGTVHGADGTAIGTGLVSASRQPGTGARSPLRTSATVIIQRDGGFQLPPFAGGVYQVCV